ncbi:MAG: endo alpha-1,4 polygalactosaminidase, partial [Rhodobacter sp.]|nr:endo alpha-1,4 polygalactosaminidase [Rhodobacter sp.]
MPKISEFILNLFEPTFAGTQAQTGDLVIIESGLTSDQSGAIDDSALTLSPSEVAALQVQGRTVIGYLNVSVTDHWRGYWNDDWVDYDGPGGGGDNNRDVGTVNSGAPEWLKDGSNHGYATDGGSTTFGYIVDYANTDWQQRVINEAVFMVTPAAQGGLGYSGLFLDDVGRYFDAQANDPGYSAAQAARDMIAFVNAIAAAVRAVNADAYITVNNGLDLGLNSVPSYGPDFALLLSNVDALLMESQYATGAWTRAKADWGADAALLAVEQAPALSDPQAFVAWAIAEGVVPHVASDASYSTPAVTPSSATTGDDQIDGGDGPNALDGEAGNDTLSGYGGKDSLMGGPGDDSLLGGTGRDNLHGGAQNDAIFGNSGADRLFGDAGDDTLSGGDGADQLFGGGGNDELIGRSGWDSLYGEIGNDLLRGSSGADLLNGGDGNDSLNGGTGVDTLLGRAGDDELFGNQGADEMFGGAGNDELFGGSGVDSLNGREGDDTLWGNEGADEMFGNSGGDLLYGGTGNDNQRGGDGNDTL